jgi:hypothetical protein
MPDPAESKGQKRGKSHSNERARERNRADLPQVADREVQAHAEHEEDHAQLRKLANRLCIPDESRCKRANGDTREQISHDGWQAQAASNDTSKKGNDQGHCNVDQ